ncbi:MAG: 16S rRNA (cytidine(1402)-2'-O)-methyltransferase [Dehalococcoidia bacterium]|nr:16S rRNA (cytidine(1402)-2'-O)-methyltransferase [Dehalococcoidia bacterium]
MQNAALWRIRRGDGCGCCFEAHRGSFRSMLDDSNGSVTAMQRAYPERAARVNEQPPEFALAAPFCEADRSMNDLAPGLYVVATPIGNLGDLSERAAAVLQAASLIAAEDTRVLRTLTERVGSRATALSLTEHNVEARIPRLLEAAREGVVALTSDAGTPVVADPGGRAVEAAHEAGIPVFAVPGPSALAAAVSVAGFDGSNVHFLGFLPRAQGERRRRLTGAASTANTLVFFESPRRLAASLGDVADALGDPPAVVCRELTKVHEEAVRGRASELAERFRETRGECTVVVDVRGWAAGSDERELRAYLEEMREAGAQRSSAASAAARRFGVPRAEAYEAWPDDKE